MIRGRLPTHRELSFTFYGTPKPTGFWPSPLGRLLCSVLEHDLPQPGAAAIMDPLPRKAAHSFIWACPRCGLRFVHTVLLPNPLPPDFDVTTPIRECLRQLYLDVLYETNRGRRLVFRWPVRSLPGLENGPAPSPVGQSTHGVLSVSPPAN